MPGAASSCRKDMGTVTSHTEPNGEQTEQQPPRPPEPPKILDRLLGDMEPAYPVDQPPKVSLPSEPVPEQVPTAPPKASIPSGVLAHRAGATQSLEGTRSEKAQPAPAMELPPVAHPSLPTPAPQKRSYASMGVVAVMTLNVLLFIVIVLMYQDRIHLRNVAFQAAPVSVSSEELPVVDVRPELSEARRHVGPQEKPPSGAANLSESRRNISTPGAIPGMLHIPKLVLSRDVSGFGDYQPIPDIPLKAHHFSYIHAYVEIADPKPERRDDGRHIYYLTKAVKLYRSDIGPTEPVMDTARSLVVGGMSPRQDFYSSQALQASRRIVPGEYTLVVSVTDQVSGETASEETTFIIHAD